MDKKFKNASNRIGVRFLIFLSCFLLMYIFMKFFEVDNPTKGKDFDSKLSITKEEAKDNNIKLQQVFSGNMRYSNENESSMKSFHVEFIVVNENKKGEILFEV